MNVTISRVMLRSDKLAGTLAASEALQWLIQYQGLSARESQQTLANLQRTQQISSIGQETDLGKGLSQSQLSGLQLQLVNCARPPKFGRALNTHYTW